LESELWIIDVAFSRAVWGGYWDDWSTPAVEFSFKTVGKALTTPCQPRTIFLITDEQLILRKACSLKQKWGRVGGTKYYYEPPLNCL
jgi:hypothetical protein